MRERVPFMYCVARGRDNYMNNYTRYIVTAQEGISNESTVNHAELLFNAYVRYLALHRECTQTCATVKFVATDCYRELFYFQNGTQSRVSCLLYENAVIVSWFKQTTDSKTSVDY